MTKRPPAFQFYATDWNGSKAVQLMSARQCGYYINLMARAWDDKPVGSLPNDQDLLWRLAKADSKAQFEHEGALVLAQFRVSRNLKRIFHPRLLSEYRKLLAYGRQKRAAGKQGAKSRWGNKKQRKLGNGSAIVSPMAENGSSSSFSSSYRRHKSSSDDDPHTLLGELQVSYPIEAPHLEFAIQQVRQRAKRPPGSLAFWRKSLAEFFQNWELEVVAYERERAGAIEARAGQNLQGRTQ